jgi:hypothetical protein
MFKNTILIAFIGLTISACQNNDNTTTAEEDSIIAIPDKVPFPQEVDNSASEKVLQPTNIEDQLTAQDTLFEDGSIPTSWENAGFNNSAEFKNFVEQFKNWVKTDNIESIAAHVSFPITGAKTPKEFKEQYAKIFTPKIKRAIETQRLDRIFRNANGAMIGNGEVWFNVGKDGYVITAINKTR